MSEISNSSRDITIDPEQASIIIAQNIVNMIMREYGRVRDVKVLTETIHRILKDTAADQRIARLPALPSKRCTARVHSVGEGVGQSDQPNLPPAA